MTDHYETLGVARSASPEVIRAAYKAQIRTAHPDLGGTEQQSQRINDAYRVLSDPASRADYDTSLGDTDTPDDESARTQSPPPRTGPQPGTHSNRGSTGAGVETPPTAPHPAPGESLLGAWAITISVVGFCVGVIASFVTAIAPAGNPMLLLGALSCALVCFSIRTRAVVVISIGVAATTLILIRGGDTFWPLILTYVSALTLHVALALTRKARRKREAIGRVSYLWARVEDSPDAAVWFVEQTANVGETTSVLLRSIDSDAAQSCVLWGNITQGSYVVLAGSDQAGEPARVPLAVAANEDMNVYLRSVRREQQRTRRRTHP